ncbi:MAG: PEP-CTERM sorting domain-containing protein [Phycisphaerae bacterium]
MGALAFVSAAQAAVVYTRNIETSIRANGGLAGFTGATTPADANRFILDDVPIPVANLGGFTSLDVTRVTLGIRRLAGAPATDIELFHSTFSDTAVAPDTIMDSPPVSAGTISLAATAVTLTQLVVFGDGVNTLFSTSLNMNVIGDGNPLNGAEFGSLLIGARFSNASSNLNGWRITSGPDANAAGVAWLYDPGLTGSPNPEFQFGFAAPTLSSFYIILEGTPVPEPTSLALLGLGALALIRRR